MTHIVTKICTSLNESLKVWYNNQLRELKLLYFIRIDQSLLDGFAGCI